MIISCVLIIITLLSYLSLMMLLIGKVLRRFQFEKKTVILSKSFTSLCEDPSPPPPLRILGRRGRGLYL